MSCASFSLLSIVVVPLSVYLSVRLGSAAYFRSKTEHESQPPKRKD